MNDSENDDDFLPSAQPSYYGARGWTSQNDAASASQTSQNRRTSTSQRSQNHGASSSQRSQGASKSQGSQNRGASTQSCQNQASSSQRSRNPGASSQGPQHETQTNSDRQQQLVHLTQGLDFLREQVEKLAKSDSGAVKSEDKKKKQKEGLKCQICHKVLANKTNLFRHYKGIHNEFHPDERFGYTVNDTVLNLDDSMTQQLRCGICGYETANKNSMDQHTYVVHSNDVDKCRVCGYKASSKDDLDNHSKSHGNNNDSVNNNGGVNNVVEAAKDKMHKCDDCDCYFIDKRKFDEHMKVMHGCEVLCKICNKNFRFINFEGHVRDSHPEVYKDKETVDERGNAIGEKNVRTKTGREKVFKCNKCNEKFVSKKDASRHVRIHKKEFRRRADSKSQVNEQNCDANKADGQTENDIMYICEACNTATASYDVVVEHSQKHIVNPYIQFATNGCDICELKFEPLCYEKHIDVHYKNKNINKDHFKYLKYKYHLLLTSDWLNFFNTEKEVVDRIISSGIYAETRSVKMRAVSGNLSFTNNLYECRQCENFVEPSTVTHHALNFDTCVRIRHSVLCNVCERSFNTEVARDKHEAVHSGHESFRIVTFNNERDREFNHKLNNTEPGVTSQVAAVNNDGNNAVEKVIYKCLCGLCFVFENSANNHVKICPGNDQKQVCQKCNNMFNLHELVDHYIQHHFYENIRLITKDIVPDVIMVSDDESKNGDAETVEILSSDDEDDRDKAKQSQNGDVTVDVTENKPQTTETENVIQNNVSAEESDLQTDLLVSDIARDVVMDGNNEGLDDHDDEEHNEPKNDENPDRSNFEVSDNEDSQNTVIFDENYTSPRNVSVRSEIKCVETNLLINPFYVRNKSEKADADERNNNLATKIETTGLKIEAPDVHIKEEILWYIDDTEINLRPVRQESYVTSTDTIIDLRELLTDDEDEVMASVSEDTDAREDINNVTDIIVNPEEITEDSHNTTVANYFQNYIERDDRHDGIMDIFRPNKNNSPNVISNNPSKEIAVLSEKQVVINSDNLKIVDETKMNTKFITQSRRNENGIHDIEMGQVIPNDNVPFRNRGNDTENRIVVNNLEIQVSGQPNCSVA